MDQAIELFFHFFYKSYYFYSQNKTLLCLKVHAYLSELKTLVQSVNWKLYEIIDDRL